MDGSGRNISIVRWSDEVRTVVIGNLTAFTLYFVTVTAFTGDVAHAHRNGKASEPVLIRTLEEGERERVSGERKRVQEYICTRVMDEQIFI